ncbi:TMEM14 protein homolog-like protein [Teratosphaeria destructans]|uniref:TMEM14 protein homolog-like protein n=1 Tax=Teratosphaeria destructans TaxID=418781 RepID=A0A9W7W5Q1_9PEZI|nr:TMEM14 protein homolog-like protein [Teratosphaeria destructans]
MSQKTNHPQPHLMSLTTIAFVLAGLTAGGGITGYVYLPLLPFLTTNPSNKQPPPGPHRLRPLHRSRLHRRRLYALGGYRLQNRQSYGVELALLASVVLAGSSIPRAIKSQKPLPAGLSALALFGLYNFGVAFANKR